MYSIGKAPWYSFIFDLLLYFGECSHHNSYMYMYVLDISTSSVSYLNILFRLCHRPNCRRVIGQSKALYESYHTMMNRLHHVTSQILEIDNCAMFVSTCI